jgi:hypothetical protein
MERDTRVLKHEMSGFKDEMGEVQTRAQAGPEGEEQVWNELTN